MQPANSAHVCTASAQPRLATFRVRTAGRLYTGHYISGCMAVLLAQCFHRVHGATAIRVDR